MHIWKALTYAPVLIGAGKPEAMAYAKIQDLFSKDNVQIPSYRSACCGG